jgi:hypothetical protein
MFDVEKFDMLFLADHRRAGDRIMRRTTPHAVALAMAAAALLAGACSNSGAPPTLPAASDAAAGQAAESSSPPAAPDILATARKSKNAPALEPAPATNTGRPAGPAFLLRLSAGFNEATQYLSSYTMEQPWNGAGFAPDNVHYGPDGATLVIQKRKMLSLSYAGGELQRKGFYGYGRYEAIVKAPSGSGVVSSFFTHTNNQFGDPHDEVDIEFLGRDTHRLHLNYFKDGVPAGSYYAPVGFDTSADFHLYAFEWAPDSIRWYADGRLVHEVHGPAARVPRATGRVIMNLWSAGPAAIDWLGPIRFKNNTKVIYRCVSHVPIGQTAPQCSDDYRPPSRLVKTSAPASSRN